MEIKKINIFNRNDFRKWLEKNHNKENKVKVILHKKHTGKHSPSHRELIEEAICFGWIDTTVKRIDEDTFERNFSRRNKNSKWSDNTLSYAKDLIKRKMMTSHGLEFYKQGLLKPTHDHGIPKNPSIPIELKNVLEKNKKAKTNFNKFSNSKKRMIYRWFLSAKLPETRKKRIKLILKRSEEGKFEF
jgi:uncharacterized protein YdeI (YjbR/CyaY-like superfamily)